MFSHAAAAAAAVMANRKVSFFSVVPKLKTYLLAREF